MGRGSMTRDLHIFLTQYDHGDNLFPALRDLCKCGGGTWLQPGDPQGHAARHPTHLIEISAHGVNAYGLTAREAVWNWRKQAYRHLAEGAA